MSASTATTTTTPSLRLVPAFCRERRTRCWEALGFRCLYFKPTLRLQVETKPDVCRCQVPLLRLELQGFEFMYTEAGKKIGVPSLYAYETKFRVRH